MKGRALLLLEWLDAGVISHGDWIEALDVERESRPERFVNHTVGWLLSEDESALVLAAQIATGEPARYDLVMFIPKALIRARKVLKV